jgi:superfamily I DNA and/or RNA helicase
MMNETLYLQPINYYTLKEELCFFMGDRVSMDKPEVRDGLIYELTHLDYLTICNHVVREEYDYYIMMTANFKFNLQRSEEYNFTITRIFSGLDFQAQKKYLYSQGVFLVITEGGTSIVADGYKHSSNKYTSSDWGMDPETFREFCDGIDAYFLSTDKNTDYRVDNRFAREILQPIKNFTKYEDLAEQLDAYKENYVNYDYYEFIKGSARKKTYRFFSSSFDPDNELYQVDDKVAIETTEEINDGYKRKIVGSISDRINEEDGTSFIIDFAEQFHDHILEKNHGHMYLKINDSQKRVRERVIQDIENGSVDSKYMYRLFGNHGHPDEGEVDAPGWEEFKTELLSNPMKPNASQMLAIERGIKTKDIQLVLGPPGTGKTTVIVNWVKYFVKHGKRVLISSQNNSAVDNVLERVGRDENARIIRIGNIDKIQDNCKQYAPEEQVGKTAKEYSDRLKSSQENILHDLSDIHAMLAYVDSVFPDYQYYLECRNVLIKNAKLQKEKLNELDQLLSQKQTSYEKYTELMEERARKSITFLSLKNKSFFFRLINRRLIKRIEQEIVNINDSLNDSVANYCEAIRNYNWNAAQLKNILNQQEYVSAKSVYEGIYQKCSNYRFDIRLTGPFSVHAIDANYLLQNEVNPVVVITSFKNELEDVFSRLTKVKASLDDWGKSIEANRTEIVTDLLVENSNVVGATCIGINSRTKFRNLSFDVSIIDESGQIQIHNAIVPMTKAPKTLMLGDHLQIPPIANEAVIKLCRDNEVPEKQIELLNKSFFEFLFTRFERQDENTHSITRLDEQFRMPGNISDVISEWFYKGKYHARYDMNKWHPMISGTNSPLIMISTSNEQKRYESAEVGGGYSNDLEAKTAAQIVALISRQAFAENKAGISTPQVGIISAYGKQVRLIRQKIKERKLGFSDEQIGSIAASLDSFQGQERPLIIYSCTRSADPQKVPPHRARVGFLKEIRRLNVAFTRCQIQLVIIGDFDYLTTCEYELLDDETGEPVPNQSEKKYSEFMTKMLNQAKSENGEFYDFKEFYERTGMSHG